jgi:hypothetical protein
MSSGAPPEYTRSRERFRALFLAYLGFAALALYLLIFEMPDATDQLVWGIVFVLLFMIAPLLGIGLYTARRKDGGGEGG